MTVTVTPGTLPTSTGVAVSANLSTIGGSATQAFFDDASNGDVTASDKVFSWNATVGAVAAGAKSLPFTITDAQARFGNGTIAFAVEPPALTIAQIQGNADTSSYDGGLVKTSGIVTGVKSNGYFIQMPAPGDGDADTSDGIFVFTSAAPPAAAVVGNAVDVIATVQEFVPSQDLNSPPVTELVSPTTIATSTGNALPTPVTLIGADTDPAGSQTQLERFEGMVVHVDSLTVVAPTDANVTESSATSSSTGVFYGVITGIARPFREPGIAVLDPVPACVPGPCSATIARFDENPEKLRVDSDAIGAPKLDLATGTVVSGLTGPLDYGFRAYTIVQYPHVAATPAGTLVAVPASDAFGSEFTVASSNIERFFDTVNDPGVSDTVLTPAAFANRLNKLSLMIRNILKSPDLIGLQEVENLGVLQAIATKLNADSGSTNYVAYLQEGNDVGGIDVGILVNTAAVGNFHNRVEVSSVTQYNKTETYIDPNDGLPALLNDRPSLVLRASVFHESGYASYPVTVVVNHLRSLSGVDDPVDGNRIRTKRRAQAESLALLLQSLQGENVVSVGDYNAFQFNDGYVDSIGTLLGTPTPENDVVLASPDLVDPDMTNVSGLEPAEEQYSFSFDGSAQELDHVLVNANALGQYSGLGHPRTNTDFPETLRNDPTRPERISDHDPSVAYFLFPITSAVSVVPDPQQYTDKVTFSVTVAPDSIQGASLLPATVEFFVGTLSMGTATLQAGVNGTLVATLADVALVEPLPSSNVEPGTHTVTAEFSNPLIPDASTSLTITQEDASAAYAGALFVSTACVTCSNATVTLAATVMDDTDPDTGDIRNATVTFVNLDTLTDISPALPVGLVNAGDTTVGVVSYEWAVDISGNSQDFTIGVRVDDYYTRDAAADAIVTVSKPLASYFITGGGYLTLASSAGITAGDIGSRNSFGYNVQYNKKGTNLQGRVNILVRHTESDGVHVYQIKGNVLSSLSVNTSNGTATFTGKANIRDVTNPLAPFTVDANATLVMTMDDNGEPGASDAIGIAVYNKAGGLWFSSNWTGTTTALQTLSGGNLIVH